MFLKAFGDHIVAKNYEWPNVFKDQNTFKTNRTKEDSQRAPMRATYKEPNLCFSKIK